MSGEEDSGFVVSNVDARVGRGVFATRPFVKGETIFRERPMVSAQFAWNAAYSYRACHECLEPLETAAENAARLSNDPAFLLLPHTECCATRTHFHVACPHCQVQYCSKECMDEAWSKYHRTLCVGSERPDPNHPLLVLTELWKSFHHPPESASITLLLRLLASIAQDEHPEDRMQKFLSLTHSTVNSDADVAHKLLGERFASQLEQLRQATAAVFSSCPAVQPLLSPEGFSSLFALIGRNGQGIGTSPISQWSKNVEKVHAPPQEKAQLDDFIEKMYASIERHAGLQFMDNEGSGLYHLQSKLNHSCVPNAVVEFPFNNHELVVNATGGIEPGEEIVISYLNECDLARSRHSRIKHLVENYLFVCECSRCRSQIGDPDVTSEEDMSDESEEDDDDDD